MADVEEMMDACELARLYSIPDCESRLLQQLQQQILLNGAAISTVLDKAASLAMPQLELLALERCSSMVITPTAFLGFSQYALILCLSAAHLKASEASILEAVINWAKHQLSNQPGLSMPDMLADVMPKVQLDQVPADVLIGITSSMDLTSHEASSLQVSQQPQAQPCLSQQYTRRPWGELGQDIACTDIDTIEFSCQQHRGARSRHCLKAGTGRYVWHLCVERYSSCTWIGLVDDTAEMTRQANQAFDMCYGLHFDRFGAEKPITSLRTCSQRCHCYHPSKKPFLAADAITRLCRMHTKPPGKTAAFNAIV